MKKPNRLKIGDTLAIVTPSWGGPACFAEVFNLGIKNLESLGFKIIIMPSACLDAQTIYHNPKLRADDIHQALQDPNIAGVISAIGGTDSARVLPYLDPEIFLENPKFFMGFSDATTITTFINQLGIVSFNGPSIMAGFSQLKTHSVEYQTYLSDFIFSNPCALKLPAFDYYSDGYPEWSEPKNLGLLKPLKVDSGPHFIQGNGVGSGQLFGGCIEVLEMIKGTQFWPNSDFWHNKILFLETSEDKPSIDYIKFWLRNYGVMGVFDKLSGLIFGRARDYSDEEKQQLDNVILQVIAIEFGQGDLPIVTNMSFGHTDPQIILSLGINYQIDTQNQSITQLESSFNETYFNREL